MRAPSGLCNWCLAPILWGHANTGRWVPLDPEPTPNGQWALLSEQRCLDMREHRDLLAPSSILHTDHRRTCGTRKAPDQ